MKKNPDSSSSYSISLILVYVLIMLILPGCNNTARVDDKGDGYNPIYWVEGAVERKQGDLTYEEARKIADDVYAKGWRGVTYWGADREGLAIETTELEIKIPGIADGSKIHVVIWDNKRIKKSEETLTYAAPFRQYDFILIDKVKIIYL